MNQQPITVSRKLSLPISIRVISTFVLTCLVSVSLMASTGGPDRGNTLGGDSKSKFEVLGHSFAGNQLYVDYMVPFPGITHLELLDESEKMLWRSQYVDDKSGKHKLAFRTSPLESGKKYVFRFKFKIQTVDMPFTAP